jgi:hypothetical protein
VLRTPGSHHSTGTPRVPGSPWEGGLEPYRDVVTLDEARAMIDAGTLRGVRLGDLYLVSVAVLADGFLPAAVQTLERPA